MTRFLCLVIFLSGSLLAQEIGTLSSSENDSELELLSPLQGGDQSRVPEGDHPGLDVFEDEYPEVLLGEDQFAEGAVLDIGIDGYGQGPGVAFQRSSERSSAEVQQQVDRMLREAAFQGRIGNRSGSLEIYRRIVEIDPGNDFARFNKGTLLIQLSRHREAIEVLNRVMESNPDNYMVRNNIAWVYATADDIAIRSGARALSYARHALLLAPSDHHVWNTLSQAYFVSARYERALKAAEIAIQLATASGAAPDSIRNAEEQLRKCRQAVATMSILE